MNITAVTIAVEEGPALGASILAMVGCGEYQTVEEACDKIVKLNSLDYINNPTVQFEEITSIDINGNSFTGRYRVSFKGIVCE